MISVGQGNPSSRFIQGGIIMLIIGGYLVYRANQKKKEKEEKEKWENDQNK